MKLVAMIGFPDSPQSGLDPDMVLNRAGPSRSSLRCTALSLAAQAARLPDRIGSVGLCLACLPGHAGPDRFSVVHRRGNPGRGIRMKRQWALAT